MIQPIRLSCRTLTSSSILLALIEAGTFRGQLRLLATNKQNKTIEQVTLRVVGKTFGYAIVFKNFSKVRNSFSADKNFTVPSDQSPSKAYDQTKGNNTFAIEFGCRGDPNKKISPAVTTFVTITGGDGRLDKIATVSSCGSKNYAGPIPF